MCILSMIYLGTCYDVVVYCVFYCAIIILHSTDYKTLG